MANQDQNLNYGWHNQKLGNTAGQSGFSQPAQTPVPASVSTASQVSAGAPVVGPNPAVTTILENPGYATGNGTILGAITAPAVPATTVGIQNPTGVAATVAVIAGTVTAVSVAPNNNGVAGTYAQVASGSGVQVTVPPAGWIKMTYSVAPTWAWTTIN
jgi:hypothetical protein